jgi:hypothetical protein
MQFKMLQLLYSDEEFDIFRRSTFGALRRILFLGMICTRDVYDYSFKDFLNYLRIMMQLFEILYRF